MNAPDFYLASSDGYGLENPRRCWVVRRLKGQRSDCLLIDIDPPVGEPTFGVGSATLSQVVVAPRHRGVSILPIGDWPVFVHVARLLTPYDGRGEFSETDIESFAWAELYPTEEAARAKWS